ncbi:hypothetical protein [Stieleria varia]|uniref:Uncharacterized protein n=1 Tax=Stieleria varia TaxID=2528005 RepID=A0A5C6B310_9BACT|nr:hypothetical protein [Stieleria varia]TWU06513.1 hypothetical protein Pla52n_22350 [Stieleria varia]
MARLARAEVFDPNEIAFAHVIARTVLVRWTSIAVAKPNVASV